MLSYLYCGFFFLLSYVLKHSIFQEARVAQELYYNVLRMQEK